MDGAVSLAVFAGAGNFKMDQNRRVYGDTYSVSGSASRSGYGAGISGQVPLSGNIRLIPYVSYESMSLGSMSLLEAQSAGATQTSVETGNPRSRPQARPPSDSSSSVPEAPFDAFALTFEIPSTSISSISAGADVRLDLTSSLSLSAGYKMILRSGDLQATGAVSFVHDADKETLELAGGSLAKTLSVIGFGAELDLRVLALEASLRNISGANTKGSSIYFGAKRAF
jgi:hypothetical protein